MSVEWKLKGDLVSI